MNFFSSFRLKGTNKTHTKGLSKFHSNIYSILYDYNRPWPDETLQSAQSQYYS